MIENELITLWQSSSKYERIKFEKSKLMIEIQSSLDRFNRGIYLRDFIEIGAAIFVIPFFAYQIYQQPNEITKFGALWIVLYVFFVIYKLLKAKRLKPKVVDSYLEYLNQSRNYLQAQKKLLSSVVYWYILPCLIGVLIMMVGILDLPSKSWHEIVKINKIWIGLTVVIVSGIITYLLNERAVKKELIPRIKDVDKLLKTLKEQD